ncbi:tyrosine-type recombinase/integrase [Methanohalobium sp.]|uniref:tyrosine-type recombinase/integrase n=1 Tax=Methanohalobium sp. TaxID=2837493 RepID=UPI003979E396
MGIYKHEKYLKRAEERVQKADYPENNKKLIFKFENHLFIRGYETSRVLKYVNTLNIISNWLQGIEFTNVTKDDIELLVGGIERSNRSNWTKHDYKYVIKRFFRWLNDGTDPQMTAWIVPKKGMNKKMPEELLSTDDIKAMITAANHPRDEAIISVLYDSALRISELGNLRFKDVTFDRYGAKLMVDGKTGPRRVRIIYSVPYLSYWMNMHPLKDDPDAPLWIDITKRNNDKQIGYDAFRRLIKTTAKRAGIKKRVHNHLFRHSRATELANYLTQAQMEDHLGWYNGSEMPRTYIHLSGNDVDDAILQMHGVQKEEEKSPQLVNTVCPICKQNNGPTSSFCANCGRALDTKSAIDIDEKKEKVTDVMQLLMSDSELNQLVQEKIDEVRG